MTRAQAEAVLDTREGWPIRENAHVSDAAVIAAASAPAGQPCSDCEQLITWSDERGWSHTVTPTRCFLARRDER